MVITQINGVVFVDKNRYPEKKTVFSGPLRSQELIFHFSGQNTVHFNGSVLEERAGTVRYLPQGAVAEYTVERSAYGACVDVFFHSDVPLAEEAFVLHLEENNRIGSLFRKLFALWVGKGSGYYPACMALLYQILAELQKRNYIPEKQYNQIRPAIRYLESHFPNPELSMEELAQLCGISYSYMKKLFLSKFGCPPKKYLIQRKLQYACDLLRTGQYTVTEIAGMCGFDSVPYFSRQFKAYMGVSPREFPGEKI